MAYNNVQTKLEAAALAILSGSMPAGYTASTGQDDQTKVANMAHVIAEGLTEVEGLTATGVFRSTLRVRVKSNAHDKTEAQHSDAVGTVFDLVNMDTMPQTLSANATDFYCLGTAGSAQIETTISDVESWNTDISIPLAVCGCDL